MKECCIKTSSNILFFGYLFELSHWGDYHKSPKYRFYQEKRIKQVLSYISFCPLRNLYNIKFIFMATSLRTNAVVVTKVDYIIFHGHNCCRHLLKQKIYPSPEQLSIIVSYFPLIIGHFISLPCLSLYYSMSKRKVREKSRECHNHKPQPFPDPKRKRKPTSLNKHKPNKRTKSTKTSPPLTKRGNRNTKRT